MLPSISIKQLEDRVVSACRARQQGHVMSCRFQGKLVCLAEEDDDCATYLPSTSDLSRQCSRSYGPIIFQVRLNCTYSGLGVAPL